MKIQRKYSHTTPVTLRTVANRVGLAPCSVSAVLNNTHAALAIPQQTKIRVLQAARELNYRPNFAARSLRTRRSFTIAVLVSDIANARVASVVAGLERALRRRGYALLIAGCEVDAKLLETQEMQLRQRGVEGVVTLDVMLPRDLSLPYEAIELSDRARLESSWDGLRNELAAVGETGAHRLLQRVEQNTLPAKTGEITETLDALLQSSVNIGAAPAASEQPFAD